MPFVLDNSVVTGWYIEAQATEYTEAIAEYLKTETAVVPALWQLEFANVLLPLAVAAGWSSIRRF